VGSVVVREVGCLGPCSTSNVVAVRPPGASQRIWLGWMLDDDATEALGEWISHGCRAPLPHALVGHELGSATSAVGR
jgi:(2Fe-2S) ferredoxin